MNWLHPHKRYKHTDPALKCKLCKYVACGEADLRIHACNESLCCGVCGTRLTSNSTSPVTRRSTTLSSTPAPSVERRTSYSGSLNRHKRNKHTDPALKCKLCKNQSRSQFIRHKEVHNSVLYSCSLCGMKTRKSEDGGTNRPFQRNDQAISPQQEIFTEDTPSQGTSAVPLTQIAKEQADHPKDRAEFPQVMETEQRCDANPVTSSPPSV
ncbi:hypothetical protein LAZ67_3005252 [Cordylochernes scorpioides]|uniref:Uncharacterized protein n=1 Tax=Cordylochernes scorpioides TaxID=51811 RepID=A0ABY6KA61_9ARAC|nr:hypothetical protein LAZ67_3005252 [Cordylochernes scorpioides]